MTCVCAKVEGTAGVAKLEACMQTLPATVLRVVIVRSSEGVEGELGPVAQSGLWSDMPNGTIVIAAIPQV